MNSRTRIGIAACTIICCLLLAMVAGIASAAPFKIYGDNHFPGGCGAPYYGNPVGGKAWFGNFGYGVQEWGDEMAMGLDADSSRPPVLTPALTACVNSTDFLPTAAYTDGNLAKAGFQLNGQIFCSNAWTAGLGGGWFSAVPTWSSTAAPVKYSWPAGSCTPAPGSVLTGDSPDCACTDGTDIYNVCASGSSNSQKNIYGWTVNHTAKTLTQKWMVSGANRHRAISYYAPTNRLYTANSTTGAIYELDPATGAGLTTPIVTASATYINQIARYANKLYAVGEAGALHTFTLSGGTWGGEVVNALGVGACRGIVLTADGKYAWISCTLGDDYITGNSGVTFWDLDPYTGTPANLSTPRRSGYPLYVSAVVTAQGPAGTFWVENPERTRAEQVLYTGSMPATGKLVTLKVTSSTNAAGEKVLTAINDTDAVAVGATASPELQPVYLTNKSMGLATGGAGLANDGMLVKISGKVIGPTIDSAGFFIDDGSGVPTGLASPDKGVKVLLADGLFMDSVANIEMVFGGTPCTAVITGIVRLEVIDGKIIRRIDARSAADIVIEAL